VRQLRYAQAHAFMLFYLRWSHSVHVHAQFAEPAMQPDVLDTAPKRTKHLGSTQMISVRQPRLLACVRCSLVSSCN
jgi:hypothetical protein